jgi:hypothetical protein
VHTLSGCLEWLCRRLNSFDGRQAVVQHSHREVILASDVVQVDGRYEYKGHLLTNPALNLDGIKKKFLDSLLKNINKRYEKKLNSTKKFSSKKNKCI